MEFIDLKQQYKKYKKDIDAAIQKVLDHASTLWAPKSKS